MPRKKSDVTITTDTADELPEPTPIRSGLPRRRKPVPKTGDSPEEQALNLARRVVELASDKKASDIVLLEIGALTTLADYFVICSGQSERQLRGIIDGIASALRDEGIKPVGKEGSATAHWMLIDYGSVIVHVMAPPERDYYQLEKLWAEAPLLVRLQ
ncbi:MAG: ribosome silencing factor [Chloroflexota bacterium]